VKYGKKYYAHDENNEAKVGDTVTIMGCRKLSATKRFRLVSIDKKAEMTIKEAEAELKEEVLEAEAPKEEKAEEPAPAEAPASKDEAKEAEPEKKEEE
jgi:predicted GIY-YIG superfamily endonuclease